MTSRRRISSFVGSALFFFLTTLSDAGASSAVIDLKGLWTVTNSGKNGPILTVQGRVPGNVYTALLASEKIQDPYYMFNDVQYRWIGREDWTYQKTFQVTADVLAKQRVILNCEGLDTVSTVRINGQVVGKSFSMFVKYHFDIKHLLKAGVNEIRVEFQSPVNYAAQKADASPHLIPPKCPALAQSGECHVNMIRKEQCSFSWDWGPSFPTMGIWKNMSIVAMDTATIEHLTADTYQGSVAGSWLLSVGVIFQLSRAGPVTGNLTLTLGGTSMKVSIPVTLTTSSKAVTYNHTLSDVYPWWPNGYGNQTLYSLNASFTSAGEITSKSVRVGFRTVELVQDPIPNAQGLTFFFKVNGLPIFMKGSNWIPADSFQDRVTEARYRDLLQSAADANMNCLRVWGGGLYEDDIFYDIADELGVMIWQDFMFAVALYPADSEFLGLVTQEVTHQVRRLKSHPSILLWAGNNENEKALAQDWFGVRAEFELYKKEYISLYIDTVMAVVQREDQSRPFVSSSPSNGKETEREGWVAKDPGDWHYGDEHFYDYTKDMWNVSTFPILRFASEYGLQSWASLETVQKVAETSEQDFKSAWCTHRQHHLLGNGQMTNEISLHFTLTQNPDKRQRFDDMIYLTQINQALGIRFESEHNRRWQSEVVNSYGLTMGALYWQLNDIWQGPTWASIEYGGKWKMLHYYAKRFFAPRLISPYIDGKTLKVYMVVDKLPSMGDNSDHVHTKTAFHERDVHGRPGYEIVHTVNMEKPTKRATVVQSLYIQMFAWTSFTPLHTWKQQFQLNSTSQLVFQAEVSEMLQTAKCPSDVGCVLVLYLDTESELTSWYPLSSFSKASLQTPHIQVTRITPSSQSSTHFTISLSTDNLAPFVWLEATGIEGRFSDNGFLLYSPSINVTFTSSQDVDPTTLKMALKIKSLKDIYNY